MFAVPFELVKKPRRYRKEMEQGGWEWGSERGSFEVYPWLQMCARPIFSEDSWPSASETQHLRGCQGTLM